MISKSQINFIKSLHTKKYRKIHSSFLVEGLKSILEFAQSSYQITSIFAQPEYVLQLKNAIANIQIFELNPKDLQKISTLQHPQGVLAVVKMPPAKEIDVFELKNEFSILLDGIQDPGNLGTIIRTADWFGIKKIICSLDCVEIFNPKVVQASMGSLTRIQFFSTSLTELLKNTDTPISYATLLKGSSIYQTQFENEGLLILGNEGNGISEEISALATHAISIPTFGSTESLNVAICAAICCSEIKRNSFQ